MVSNNACATLRFTAVRAEGLKNLQMMIDQDPFVQLQLLPWGDEAKTKAASGVNPNWDPKKHKSVMRLPYPGRPVPPKHAVLDVKVMDAEVTRAARLIGGTTVDLTKWIALGDTEQEMTLSLLDAKGKDAGTLYMTFQVELVGQVEAKILSASNLKNLQRYIEQDPYVRATLLPCEDDKKRQTRETKVASGVNPVWKKKNVLTFDYMGEESPRLLIECFDKEYTRKDRLIGTGAVELNSRVVNFRASPDQVAELTVELTDPDFLPAGRVSLEVRFINAAYDESKEAVRGLPSQLSMKNLQSFQNGDIVTQLKSVYLHMEGELEHNAPDFVVKISKITGIPRTVVAMSAYGVVAAVALAILLVAGPGLLSLLIGFLYPSYMSFKAIESVEKDDDTQWLTYWCVFGVFTVIEETLLRAIKLLNPVYGVLIFFFKAVFLIWLQSPSSRGALYLYKTRIAPFLRRNEAKVDKTIAKARKKAKEVDDRIRVPVGDDDEPDAES